MFELKNICFFSIILIGDFMWKIRDLEIKNQVVLAPMAGISNPAYMKIVEEMGCGLAITELISSEAIIRDNKKTWDMLHGIDQLNMPVAIQLFGSNPDVMAKAASMIVERYPVTLLDINMGCPVPKVAVRASAGSALLKEPDKVYEMVSKVVNSVSVPVTVKIRSGWDDKHINAVEIAKKCEAAGASAITVHGRTRAQGYSGKVNLDIIKAVKENVSIPVIGNGDIKSYLDAKKMLDTTGCDAVMIGRGVLGNPWLIKEVVDYLEDGTLPSEVTWQDKMHMLKKHFNLLLQTKGEKLALLEIRSHAAWYMKGIPGCAPLKQEICQVKTKEEFFFLIDQFISKKGESNA